MESAWYRTEDDKLAGLTLGFDFCAEHEESVKGLHRKFGVPAGLPQGLKDRKIREVPNDLTFVEFSLKPRDRRRKAFGCALLTTEPRIVDEVRQGRYLPFWSDPQDKYHKESHDLACAWSESDFAVLVRGEDNLRLLAELHEAFQRRDILFAAIKAGFAVRQGLTFMVDSRVPDEARENILAQDLEHKRLLDMAAATGIEERLKAAGRGWFSLAPDWADEAHETIRFWLNPYEQERYNHGWYTVEQLDAWAAGHGPIVKQSGTT